MKSVSSVFRKAGFALVNVWLAFHVFAIFVSPAPMPPASPLLVDASRVALPYNQLMFLNHGYHFFAPDPGPSSLISYRVEIEGEAPIKGRFPDTSIFPRLRYHRYFMLAENVWGFPEQTQEECLRAYARHFANRHNAEKIALISVSHRPSSISRILAGGELSDPETFDEELLEEYDFSKRATKPVTTEIELTPVTEAIVPAAASSEAIDDRTHPGGIPAVGSHASL